MTQLYKHQESVLADNPARILLAHSTGTGKTLTAIELAKKNALTILVVVPKMLKEKWARDIEEHGGGKVYKIISKEEFKRDVKTLLPYDCLIIDEAHYFAGMKSQLHKAMVWYVKKFDTKYRYLLTATPYLSTPLNIFALATILGHSWNYRTFVSHFFWNIQMGHRMVMKAKDGIEGEIAELVAKIGHIVDMEEIVDVPLQTHTVINVMLTDEQKTAKQEFAYTESTHIEQWTTEHQIENGFIYTDSDKFKLIVDHKYAQIFEIAKVTPKLAIFCRYKAQIEIIKGMFQSIPEIRREVFELHGGIDKRDAVISEANSSDHCVIIIQTACSAGYELPTFGTIIFASLSFSYVDTVQALGRFLRINKLKENRYIFLVCEGVDEAVYEAYINKQDFDFAIYGKRRLSDNQADGRIDK